MGSAASDSGDIGLDVASMWDFGDPAASEARFEEALLTASGDDALVLRTQIARTWSLRGDQERARAILDELAPALEAAGPEPRARAWLERGRTWISAVTTPEERTSESLAAARDAYGRAVDVARDGGFDELAIDALHMMAFVDTAPAEQLAWNERALAIAAASSRPAGRRWEASLRNNLGMALHEAGRDEEALAEFRRALALREAQGDAGAVRVAWWMIGWVLRLLGRGDEAREIQLRLEREGDEAGEPDPYVFEELEQLARDAGDEAQASHYAARRAATG
jgi:tetratricopeptide (TPR) repeat protein